jgi:trans-aconitate 2-methyltransferase
MSDPRSSASYTFGDNDLAAERLRLLAAAYEPSSRAFIERLGREPPRVAIDLGCGLGYTTALLQAETGAALTVTQVPFPAPPADLLYGRFIVTHLPDADAALARWAAGTAPRGRLALEEVDSLAADDAVLTRYYALVEAMQAARGQRTYIGRDLAALPASSPWTVERADAVPIALPAAVAARLHALNLRTWRRDPFIAATVGAEELDRLGASLESLADGTRTAAPVRWRLAQVVLRRR